MAGLVHPKEAPNFCAELRDVLDHLLPDVRTVEIKYAGEDNERARYVDSIILRIRERRRADE